MPEPSPAQTALLDQLELLLELPDVRARADDAREACTRLRFHEALRRRIPEAAAESRVRGARASAALDGADFPVELVRELMSGARDWPLDPDPGLQVLRERWRRRPRASGSSRSCGRLRCRRSPGCTSRPPAPA